ncbi:MAG: hypothetical protein KF745_10320 [Phycisphaeraceae bacterium]|nr:hypothetical protein [Phycisphaeraceae bacterium]
MPSRSDLMRNWWTTHQSFEFTAAPVQAVLATVIACIVAFVALYVSAAVGWWLRGRADRRRRFPGETQ